jgi:aconitate hydratase
MQGTTETKILLTLPNMTREERDIVLAGCLMNYYALSL